MRYDKRFQGQLGEEYDLFYRACPDAVELQAELGKIVRRLAAASQKEVIDVLEIGCGTGYTTRILLSADPRIKIMAIDNAAVMIKQAQHNLQELITEGRVSLVEADASSYLESQVGNAKGKMYDLCVSALTLHNMEARYRYSVLAASYYLLKPDGILINADKYAYDDEKAQKRALNREFKQLRKAFNDMGRPELGEAWVQHYIEDEKPDRIMREQESIERLLTIGFRKIRIAYRKGMGAILAAATNYETEVCSL